MIQDFTLHTHTDLFDGKNTATEMIDAACRCGMVAIGISNHFIVHPDIVDSASYAAALCGGYAEMYMDNFDGAISEFRHHYDELREIAKRESVQVFCGMEVDFFPSVAWRDGFERALRILKPDYVIGAGHFVEYNGCLCNIHDMANADDIARDEMLVLYWDKIQQMARSGLFNWLAHIDLPKKRGLGREERWIDVESRTVDVIARTGTRLEINAKGFVLPFNEPYPSARILKQVADADIPVLISDDAHAIEQVGRNFADAECFAERCGVKNRLSLQKILDFSNKSI